MESTEPMLVQEVEYEKNPVWHFVLDVLVRLRHIKFGMTLFTFLQTQVLKGFNLGTRLILLLKIKILDKKHMFVVAIVTIDFIMSHC